MLTELLEVISPYLWEILGIILTFITSYIGLKLKSLYEKKINTETKRQIVKSVVEMVEQVSKSQGWTSKEKLSKAKENILQLVKKSKLSMSELELNVLIESVCNSFKKSIS
jgi:ElaB/YqjD/DUF883 family membrane-anchored ribosome-binding protein